jgi:prepilin-type N-terminal cleavage/methylation domain-containing protein
MRLGATVQGLRARGKWSVERGAWSVAARPTTHHGTRPTFASAFTLIELMVVVGIMAIVMGMSAPAIYHIWHKESLRKSVQDVTDACEQARALAIMRGTMAELVFHAEGGRFEVRGGAPAQSSGGEGATPVQVSAPGSTAGLSGVLPDTLGIAALKVNGVNCMDIEEAHVRFWPNGTCDELRLLLLEPKSGEIRGIFTEITTSLVSVETDKFRLQSELR